MKPKVFISLLLLIPLMNSCVPDGEIETLEGSWRCQETSEIYENSMKGTSIFPVYFAQDVENDNIYYIDNFYQLGTDVEVKVKFSNGELILEKQTVDGIEFVGSGVVNTSYDLINFNYTADDKGGEVDHVTAVYTR